jgi:hypothetical protein
MSQVLVSVVAFLVVTFGWLAFGVLIQWGWMLLPVGIPLVVLLAGLLRRTTIWRAFWCPFARRSVEVRFVREGFNGVSHVVEVQSCSAFRPSSQVRCAKRCLEAANHHEIEMAPVQTVTA